MVETSGVACGIAAPVLSGPASLDRAPGHQCDRRALMRNGFRLLGGLRHALACDPALEVCERALGDRALLRDGLRRSAQALAVRSLVRHARERWKQSEIDVHRLERARAGV